MKKKILMFIAMIASYYNYTYGQATNSFPASGNIGIGTITPNTALSVFTPNFAIGARNSIITAQANNTTVGSVYSTVEAIGPFGWGLAFDTYRTNVGQVEAMRISNNGNVGIGTITPVATLDIAGPSGVVDFAGTSRLGLTVRSLGSSDQAGIDFSANWGGADNPLARIAMVTTFTGSKLQFGTSNNYASGITNTAMTIDQTGNIAIGTNDSRGNKLAVNGNVIATSVTVKLNANWPDYVFKTGYDLPSLSAVKVYIDQNQHLPEMPSEQEIAKYGLNLGEMNRLLVKKVEELTLYLIEKDKNEKVQNSINLELKAEIQQMKAQMDALYKKIFNK